MQGGSKSLTFTCKYFLCFELAPGKRNSNSHGVRPVHQIIPMMKWIRTSRLSRQNSGLTKKNTLSEGRPGTPPCGGSRVDDLRIRFSGSRFKFSQQVTGPGSKRVEGRPGTRGQDGKVDGQALICLQKGVRRYLTRFLGCQ